MQVTQNHPRLKAMNSIPFAHLFGHVRDYFQAWGLGRACHWGTTFQLPMPSQAMAHILLGFRTGHLKTTVPALTGTPRKAFPPTLTIRQLF